MQPETIDTAVSKFINVINRWTKWADDRQIFAKVWPGSEVPDWYDSTRLHNHFYMKMNSESGGDGYEFLLRLDRNNFRRAWTAVLPNEDPNDMFLAKNFALYFNMLPIRGTFVEKYQSMDKNKLYEILQEYIDKGYHLYY